MSMQYLDRVRYVEGSEAAQVAFDGATHLETTNIRAKFDLERVMIIIGTAGGAPAASGNFTFTISKASPIDAAPVVVATCVGPAAAVVVGDVMVFDLVLEVAQAAGEDALEPGNPDMPRSVINVGPAGPVTFEPGDAIEFDITVPFTTTGDGFIVYEGIEHDTANPNALVNLIPGQYKKV